MPFIHFRPITVITLNDGVDSDLNLGMYHGLQASWIGMFGSGNIAGGADAGGMGLFGGTAASASGASIVLLGCNNASPGQMIFEVPDAAKVLDVTVMTIAGVTDTPFLNMLSHRISGLAQATTNMDAAPLTKIWIAWTPTLTWTGGITPAAITKTARWCQIGKVAFFECTVSSADSNACTGVTISLPVNHATNSITIPISAIEYAPPTVPTSIDPLGYIDSAASIIAFLQFRTATDGQAIVLYLSGQYEVA